MICVRVKNAFSSTLCQGSLTGGVFWDLSGKRFSLYLLYESSHFLITGVRKASFLVMGIRKVIF